MIFNVLILYWCIWYCYSHLFTCQIFVIWWCYIWCLGTNALARLEGKVITEFLGWQKLWVERQRSNLGTSQLASKGLSLPPYLYFISHHGCVFFATGLLLAVKLTLRHFVTLFEFIHFWYYFYSTIMCRVILSSTQIVWVDVSAFDYNDWSSIIISRQASIHSELEPHLQLERILTSPRYSHP